VAHTRRALLRQVFEGTSGIDTKSTAIQFTGEARAQPRGAPLAAAR
jgi:vacuolar-type H+-ATPase subunit B/Vma2